MNLICLIFGHKYEAVEKYIDNNVQSIIQMYCKRCGKYRKSKLK
jgi:hypothetical protein